MKPFWFGVTPGRSMSLYPWLEGTPRYRAMLALRRKVWVGEHMFNQNYYRTREAYGARLYLKHMAAGLIEHDRIIRGEE